MEKNEVFNKEFSEILEKHCLYLSVKFISTSGKDLAINPQFELQAVDSLLKPISCPTNRCVQITDTEADSKKMLSAS